MKRNGDRGINPPVHLDEPVPRASLREALRPYAWAFLILLYGVAFYGAWLVTP